MSTSPHAAGTARAASLGMFPQPFVVAAVLVAILGGALVVVDWLGSAFPGDVDAVGLRFPFGSSLVTGALLALALAIVLGGS